ncbi:ABC transporter ATP-binding protein [Coriobacteriia bacterium Es71-Z0120]|uniref:ABC transporter ATP-binding protein n=1 Tax=Parvivirga hydrogeniphila TaxID=2939460 RepID=UPI002260AE65|nr:ABC transporter ATP-binding protein [Parvivirga hydrogeniphila]MCL4079167.1 ABC transporter ATP-binding protein [Parvivirga hydrogeniphila]
MSVDAPADVAIRVEGARKVYRSLVGRPKEAVRDVSITVARGTIHGVLGPNGAGKTTTLKMLLGLVRPTGGRFEILGRDALDLASRRRVGFLPEQPYFPVNLTAMQAMRFYGALTGVATERLDEEAASLLERVGLADAARTELKKFSRGMLQRLGIAQALLGSPEVVVLDEPASGLDPVGQRDVRNLMLDLRAEGTTVLLSSHQLSEVEAVCDRVTIINRGVVVAEDHIDRLLNVEGKTAVRARGIAKLPEAVAALADDVAFSGSVWAFSVPDEAVRTVVDAIDDAGGVVLAVQPKRESLEDYFARLLASAGEEVA